jgi:hypothetical protein
MEKVNDTNIADTFRGDLELYLQMFCEEHNINDMTNESQLRWNAALMYIRSHVFPDRKLLKSNKNIKRENSNGIMDSNYNAYDYDLLNDICDYYIYLCMVNSKDVSVNGFCYLTGINLDSIYGWKNGETRLSNRSSEIFQKLDKNREECWVGKLASMKHPTAMAILLNKHYEYNLPGVSKEGANKQSLTASQLPKLGGNRTQFQITDNNRDDKVIDTIPNNSKTT